MTQWRVWFWLSVTSVCVTGWTGCGAVDPAPQDLSPGVAIKQEGMDDLQQKLAEKIRSAPVKAMSQSGLAGALGGARVKLLKTGDQRVLLPLPQLADGQIPLCFYIRSIPADAAVEYRLQRREKSNDIVSVTLNGEVHQEIQLEWSAVILVAGKTVTNNSAKPESYRPSSGCVQADSEEIIKLAEELWPENGQVNDYAANIQRFIRDMKRAKQPRTLDALGILDSGANGICTANANLALALLRAKEIASRSIAVIPPISQRLEMHRIVEYYHEDQWLPFDPSSLHGDVPMSPWQSVIMAKTTLADENRSMKPRMGTMVGCPYGQELELLSSGITLWGKDFFWTIAKPLAEFQPNDDAIALANDAWNQYLKDGTLSLGQIKASSATNSGDLLEILKPKTSDNP